MDVRQYGSKDLPFLQTGLDGGVMLDLVMVAAGLGFFALAILYTYICEKL